MDPHHVNMHKSILFIPCLTCCHVVLVMGVDGPVLDTPDTRQRWVSGRPGTPGVGDWRHRDKAQSDQTREMGTIWGGGHM